MERLDKILANLGFGSRKDIKISMKKGTVTVNGVVVKDASMKVDPENDVIVFEGEEIVYRKFIYLMMNKPAGVVSATLDNHDKTVIDLLPFDYTPFDPFPVGRLDKDTVGLLLITNDGELNHKLLAPKSHVDKVYAVELENPVTEADIAAFEKGILLEDGYRCLPAKLEVRSEDRKEAHVTIREGKFHQVKRMFLARDNRVTYLQRIAFGPLVLDEALEEGEIRELTEDEVEQLRNAKI